MFTTYLGRVLWKFWFFVVDLFLVAIATSLFYLIGRGLHGFTHYLCLWANVASFTAILWPPSVPLYFITLGALFFALWIIFFLLIRVLDNQLHSSFAWKSRKQRIRELYPE